MNNNDIVNTFKIRSKNYNKDMTWLEKPSLLIPMIPIPFGDGKALDICTGTGVIAKKLYEQGWNVVAGDISIEMLSQIGDFAERLVADICELPFDDCSFDLIVCRQGLQYVDLTRALLSLQRVAKTEIRLGHVTINDDRDFEFWYKYHLKASPGRKNEFYPNQLSSLIQNIGLEIIAQKVVIDQSSVIMPLDYMDEAVKKDLIKDLIATSEEFKKRNGICYLPNGDLVRDRRWEFITCKV